MEKTMDKIVQVAKARGFVYPGSEIYGGLANTWDYGNLGVELKNNVKRAWWQKFVMENPYNVGVDCAIFMYEFSPMTFKVSLRSNEKLDVSKVAEFFGGGGHTRAAGCTLNGTFHDVVNNVSAQIEKWIQ